MTPTAHRRALIFIDFEGSSLTGWPIEVGWAQILDNKVISDSRLIRPEPDWDDSEWDPLAEEIHGLSRAMLMAAGRPAAAVAQEVVGRLAGRTIISDAAPYDTAFLARLLATMDAPATQPTIRDIVAMRRARPSADWRRVEAHLSSMATVHRAGPDAASLAASWLAAGLDA